MDVTHKQHYVPQRYLTSWLTNNELFVYDILHNKIKRKGTKAICFEMDYYKFDKLNHDEQSLFRKLYRNVPLILRNKIEEIMLIPFSEIEISSDSIEVQKSVMQIFYEHINEIETNVFIEAGELFACDIESGIDDSIWDSLYNENYSFLLDDQKRVDFMSFIIGQMYRVPKAKEHLSNAVNEFNEKNSSNLSTDRIFPYFMLFQSMIISSIISDKGSIHLHFLKKDSSSLNSFITSDNPISNLDITAKTLELYWPLSPNLAVIISTTKSNGTEIVTDKEIDVLNSFVKANATRYLISNNQDISNVK